MTFLLVLLVLALALAGGFVGDLLEVAAWLLLILVLLGAAAGYVAYRLVRALTGR